MGGDTTAHVAKAATFTIPIVFRLGSDPVQAGLVASLNHPGGNLTGVTTLNAEVMPKRLELLHELLPRANVVALLVNPSNTNATSITQIVEAAGRKLGLEIQVIHVRSETEFD